MKKVVIDIYGADNGTLPILKGAADVLLKNEELNVVFVGDAGTVTSAMNEYGIPKDRYEIVHTDEMIKNTDIPTDIFKGHAKENCSMGLALDTLANDGDTVGLLSAGNTGALLIGSIFRLGLVKGLKMPALSTNLPCMEEGKFVCLVDCGANVDCKAKNLCDFALLGNAYAKSVYGLESPRIGLMSVGREDNKGNALTKEAFAALKELPVNFIGNLEGTDLFTGEADVIVCDGYAGNLLLKNAEAVGKYGVAMIEELAKKHPVSEEFLEAARAMFSYRLDFNSNGGATFLGTKKTVIKMHGRANAHTVEACIDQMDLLHERSFDKYIASALAQ